MSLINYQVELKLRWAKHFLLSFAANNNDEANLDNIIFRSKAQILLAPVIALSANGNQKLSKLFSKGLERSVYWNEYKTKSENKDTKSL